MIDKIVLQIPFLYCTFEYDHSLELISDNFEDIFKLPLNPWDLKIPVSIKSQYLIFKTSAKQIFIKENGKITAEDIFCPWESLKSSHGGLAIKPYINGNGTQKCPYLEIKCSPAKLAQSHNVYGTINIEKCITNMYTVLVQYFPEINGILDFDHARLSEIDITYSSYVPNEHHRKAIIDVLAHTSKGQTKNRGDAYTTTAYFGSKNSTVKKIKVYLKGSELENDIKNRKKEGLEIPDESVQQIAENLVRFELTLKRQWFIKRNIDTNLKAFINRFDRSHKPENTLRALYIEGTKDLFDAMKGKIMTITNDNDVYKMIDATHSETRGKTARLLGFYQSLKAVGYENLKLQIPERSFRRQIKDLEDAGFSRSQLCSLHVNNGSVILSFPQIIKIDCLKDFAPHGYEYPILQIA